jgi:hypothetical protein
MEFSYKIYVSISHFTNGMSLYYSKIFYNLEVLDPPQEQV